VFQFSFSAIMLYITFHGSFVNEDDDVSGELQTLFLTLLLTLRIFTA